MHKSSSDLGFLLWVQQMSCVLHPTGPLSYKISQVSGVARIKSRHYGIARLHYNDVTMSTMASQITSIAIVYSSVYSDADQRKHQSSVPLAFVRGIHRWPMNSPHKGPVTRKMFPFDDVIMIWRSLRRVNRPHTPHALGHVAWTKVIFQNLLWLKKLKKSFTLQFILCLCMLNHLHHIDNHAFKC